MSRTKLIGPIFCLCFACSCQQNNNPASTASKEDSGPSQNSVQREVDQASTFRKELFDKAHRAALEFSVEERIPLSIELQLIESSIKSEDEENVFKVFKLIEAYQIDRRVLEEAYKSTKIIDDKFSELTPGAKGLMKQYSPQEFDELSISSSIYRKGGVVMSSSFSSDLGDAMDVLAKHQKITPNEEDGIKWIDYESTKKQTEIIERAAIKTVGELINNEGKPR